MSTHRNSESAMRSTLAETKLKPENEREKLLTQMTSEIKQIGSGAFSVTFPFCNELFFVDSIRKLATIKPIQTSQLRAALLVGESNYLSMLPELSIHAEIVILNDINQSIQNHMKHMLTCFRESNSKEEFEVAYKKNNPLDGSLDMNKEIRTANSLFNDLRRLKSNLREKHFLSSDARYLECKKALEKLTIIDAAVDMSNEESCTALSTIIQKHGAQLTLLNMTNLQHYIVSDKLLNNILLKKNIDTNSAIIMYSVGHMDYSDKKDLLSKLVVGVSEYCKMLNYKNLLLQGGVSINQTTIDKINILIKNIINEANLAEIYTPQIEKGIKKGLWGEPKGYQFVLKRPDLKPESTNADMIKEIYLFFAKEMMNYWGATCYYSDQQLLSLHYVVIVPARAVLFLNEKQSLLVDRLKEHLANKFNIKPPDEKEASKQQFKS